MTAGMALIIVIVIVVVFSGFGSLVWYAFRFEVANFQLSNNNIYLKSERDSENPDKISSIKAENIAGSKAPLKILHLSDFHLRDDFKGPKLANFINILSFESYDFIFITGDMVEKDGLQNKLIETLKPLKAKYGVYAVFGAHDYFNKKPAEFIKNMFKKKESYSRKNDVAGLRRKLESIGIKVLQNENLILKGVAGYDEIDIVGVDDPLINKMDLKKSLSGIFQNDEDIKIINVSPESLSLKDFSNTQGYKDSKLIGSNQSENGEFEYQKNQYLINSEKIIKTKEYKEAFGLSLNKYHSLGESKKLKIALIHTPDSYALVNLALNGIDIVFAGHTHGGQIRVPAIGAIISGCNLKTKYAAGLFYFKDFVLQVSKGLGEGRFSRFRIYCAPEAIITTIKEV